MLRSESRESKSEILGRPELVSDILPPTSQPCLSTPKLLTYLVTLCFEMRHPKQNTVARLKWNILGLQQFFVHPKFWAGYATAPRATASFAFPIALLLITTTPYYIHNWLDQRGFINQILLYTFIARFHSVDYLEGKCFGTVFMVPCANFKILIIESS